MKPRSIRRALAAVALLVLAPLTACSAGAVPPVPAPASTSAPVAADATAASIPAPADKPAGADKPALPPQGAGAQDRAYPIVAGTSCAGHGRAEDPGRPVFRREGNTFSREETWGCGCPKRDVFTMVYEPKTSPLKVRLCVDPQADTCEVACQMTLKWNLEGPLKEASASEVRFVE